MKAFLILEDGTVFTGTSIGSTKDMISEIAFNTSMTGYLEVLTDPSYAGQAIARRAHSSRSRSDATCATTGAYASRARTQASAAAWLSTLTE